MHTPGPSPDEQMGLVEGLGLPKSDVMGLWLFDEPDYLSNTYAQLDVGFVSLHRHKSETIPESDGRYAGTEVRIVLLYGTFTGMSIIYGLMSEFEIKFFGGLFNGWMLKRTEIYSK